MRKRRGTATRRSTRPSMQPSPRCARTMPIVVFDTMVFVRGLINPRSVWGRLLFHSYDRYTLVFSQPLVIELLDVLRRPEVHRKFRAMAGLDLRRLLQIAGEAAWVDVTDVPLVSRDP